MTVPGIDYPGSRYDRAFDIASDVINENFTARKIWLVLSDHRSTPFRASLMFFKSLAFNFKIRFSIQFVRNAGPGTRKSHPENYS